MRIIAGRLRGLTLAPVGKGDSAAHLRPTTDRVRESIFNLLQNGGYGDPVQGARVLDLFAGTGALGLESLSRGAIEATFVDDGRKAQGLIRRNVDLCRVGDVTHLIRQNATRLGRCPEAGFDLVFLDPPYGMGLGDKALLAANEGGWISPDALILWEENASQMPPPGFRLLDARRYGETWVHILARMA